MQQVVGAVAAPATLQAILAHNAPDFLTTA
jgi:hypothetical protein